MCKQVAYPICRTYSSVLGVSALTLPLTHMPIEVSVVIPCRNEEQTLAASITSAQALLHQLQLPGEIIVVNNNSQDRSGQIANDMKVRVVDEPQAGYGHAIRKGMSMAHGSYIVIGDADDTYNFTEAAAMIQRLKQGACDMIIGTRIKGRIAPSAMPWLHRYIGTPMLTWLCNTLFGTRLSDINCGLRAYTATCGKHMQLQSPGMEIASEMIIRAIQQKMRVQEVPVSLQPSVSGRDSHLHPIHDGLRHVRLMWQHYQSRALLPNQ
jgi:glycosyltransferase involved in cell wall biosynthesis